MKEIPHYEKINCTKLLQVTLLCQEAAVAALQDDINCQKVCRQHFIKALSAIVPRTSKDSIERYKSYYAQSGLYMI